jgi:Peptidase M15
VAVEEEGGLGRVRHWRLLLLLVLALAAAGFAAWKLAPERLEAVAEALGPTQDHAAFERWLAEEPQHRADFAEFEAYLASKSVADVVPVWQLTRSDSGLAATCAGGPFAVPPQNLWDNALPVLRFVREKVVPQIGPVEAVSAWRSPRANRCSNGASRSKHLSFSGIDFVAERPIENRELFARLCALQAKLGPASHFGLGAYFDPAKPQVNRKGRFHIDVAGFRSWGFGYRGESSGCRLL